MATSDRLVGADTPELQEERKRLRAADGKGFACDEDSARDDEPERTYNGDEDVVMMATPAPEPIEHRLRRAWLNGFKEGVERAAYSIEGWGRWDS